jgi:hypothetical protein
MGEVAQSAAGIKWQFMLTKLGQQKLLCNPKDTVMMNTNPGVPMRRITWSEDAKAVYFSLFA